MPHGSGRLGLYHERTVVEFTRSHTIPAVLFDIDGSETANSTTLDHGRRFRSHGASMDDLSGTSDRGYRQNPDGTSAATGEVVAEGIA
jgi:hypothetical protein